MARRGGTKGADTVAQDAELFGGYERGRGELDDGLSDTIRIGAARAESALAGDKTTKLCSVYLAWHFARTATFLWSNWRC